MVSDSVGSWKHLGAMAEENFAAMVGGEQFEEELLEFHNMISRKIDQFGIKIEEQIDQFDAHICEKLDDCISRLHQILRDQGLPVPSKPSQPPSKVVNPPQVTHIFLNSRSAPQSSIPLGPLLQTTQDFLGSKLVLQSSTFSSSLLVKGDDLQMEVQEGKLPSLTVAKRESERPIFHLEVQPKEHAVKLGDSPIPNLQECIEKSVLGDSDLSDNSIGSSLLSLGVHNQYDSYCKFSGILRGMNNAHKLFDEMPMRSLEVVFKEVTNRGHVLEASPISKFVVHYGVVDMFAFDPGGLPEANWIFESAIEFVFEECWDSASYRLKELSVFPILHASYLFEKTSKLENYVFDPGGGKHKRRLAEFEGLLPLFMPILLQLEHISSSVQPSSERDVLLFRPEVPVIRKHRTSNFLRPLITISRFPSCIEDSKFDFEDICGNRDVVNVGINEQKSKWARLNVQVIVEDSIFSFGTIGEFKEMHEPTSKNFNESFVFIVSIHEEPMCGLSVSVGMGAAIYRDFQFIGTPEGACLCSMCCYVRFSLVLT